MKQLATRISVDLICDAIQSKVRKSRLAAPQLRSHTHEAAQTRCFVGESKLCTLQSNTETGDRSGCRMKSSGLGASGREFG